jgi:hypothetical protein
LIPEGKSLFAGFGYLVVLSHKPSLTRQNLAACLTLLPGTQQISAILISLPKKAPSFVVRPATGSIAP